MILIDILEEPRKLWAFVELDCTSYHSKGLVSRNSDTNYHHYCYRTISLIHAQKIKFMGAFLYHIYSLW